MNKKILVCACTAWLIAFTYCDLQAHKAGHPKRIDYAFSWISKIVDELTDDGLKA